MGTFRASIQHWSYFWSPYRRPTLMYLWPSSQTAWRTLQLKLPYFRSERLKLRPDLRFLSWSSLLAGVAGQLQVRICKFICRLIVACMRMRREKIMKSFSRRERELSDVHQSQDRGFFSSAYQRHTIWATVWRNAIQWSYTFT